MPHVIRPHFSTRLPIAAFVDEWDRTFADEILELDQLGSFRAGDLEAAVPGLSRVETDRIMHALVVRSHAGCVTSERLLLMLMLAKVSSLVRTCKGLRDLPWDTGISIALSAMWEAIRLQKPHITTSVSGNIGLNALNIITRMTRVDDHEVQLQEQQLQLLVDSIVPAGPSEPRLTDSAHDDLVQLLTWALDSKAVTRDEVRILARVDLGESHERAELAAELEISESALTKRAWRIRQKLMTAVQEHIRTHGRW